MNKPQTELSIKFEIRKKLMMLDSDMDEHTLTKDEINWIVNNTDAKIMEKGLLEYVRTFNHTQLGLDVVEALRMVSSKLIAEEEPEDMLHSVYVLLDGDDDAFLSFILNAVLGLTDLDKESLIDNMYLLHTMFLYGSAMDFGDREGGLEVLFDAFKDIPDFYHQLMSTITRHNEYDICIKMLYSSLIPMGMLHEYVNKVVNGEYSHICPDFMVILDREGFLS